MCAMPLAYCTPGAEVEKILEFVRDAEGNPIRIQHPIPGAEPQNITPWVEYKFQKAKVRERGFIVKVGYPGDETFSSDQVNYVDVKFQVGKDPERCLPSQLNLIRVANEKALMALKNETAIQEANNGLLDDLKKPVAIDRTGVEKGKSMSPIEAQKYAKK